MNEQKSYGVDIIKELGLENLPQDQKDEIVVALSQALQTRITGKVMEVLSLPEKEELENLTSEGDDQKIGEFITSKVPGLNAMAYDEMQKMKLELKSLNEDIVAATQRLQGK